MESNSSSSNFAFELEPIDPRRLRDAKGTVLWETVQGKRNRISIGYPRCFHENKPSKKGLLTLDDTKLFPISQFEYYSLELTFTLLPDRGCRFRSADLILELKSTNNRLGPPLVLRLQPAIQSTQKSIIMEEGVKSGISAGGDQILKVLNIEAATSKTRKEELAKTMVSMESFGNSTRQAGWRFQITDTQEIPLTSNSLRALIVQRKDKPTSIELNLTSEIEINAKLDEWLTWAFKRKEDPAIQFQYRIPPKEAE